MGLFDFFKKKSSPSAPPPPAAGDKNVARLGRTAADKLAQNYDRLEAIETLARIRSAEAAAALLKRFTFAIEPSITDQEEKEIAFQGIVACGEEALAPTIAFCEKAESLTWPLKVLHEILPADRYVEEVLDLLDGFDTDYSRNVDPKIHLIDALENQKSDEVIEVLLRFLDDVSEPVRFRTILVLFSLEDPTIVPKVLEKAINEESVRLVAKVADCIAARSWTVPAEFRDSFARVLQSSASRYDIDGDGRILT